MIGKSARESIVISITTVARLQTVARARPGWTTAILRRIVVLARLATVVLARLATVVLARLATVVLAPVVIVVLVPVVIADLARLATADLARAVATSIETAARAPVAIEAPDVTVHLARRSA
jgi:hypothetical protein